jgi:predicted signal transduction protein with EAL and GGDEF domain/CheY-like chemotaxis protein
MSFADIRFKALIADRDAERRSRTVEIVRKNGLEAVACAPSSFDDCLETAGPIGLFVLADDGEGDGLRICRDLRRRDSCRAAPILMFTPAMNTETLEAAYSAGATETLPVPLAWAAVDRRLAHLADFLRYNRVYEESRSRNAAFLRAIPDVIVVADAESYELRQLSSGSGERFSFGHHPDRLVRSWKQDIRHVVETGEVRTTEFSDDNDGSRRYFEMRMVRYTQNDVLMIIRDISAQKRASAKVYRLAFYDPLTGLPNRQSFMTRISVAIRDAADSGGRFSILYLDIDNFKRVNDSLGHSVGDELLKQIARRIEDCVRTDDVIARATAAPATSGLQMARLGGDEFTVLLRGADLSEATDLIADRVTKAVSQPILYDGRQFVFTCSVGIVCFPDDGIDMDTLIANADMAMYRAKESGKNTVRSFSDTMSVRSLEYLDLENELRQTIAAGGLALHYQPKQSLRSGTITGFEALCRWFHPERGYIPPDKFVRIAIDAGMILELSDWVLDEACRQLSLWQKGPLAGLPVAINLSGQQFTHGDVHSTIVNAIAKHGLEPRLLELELTEGELMADAERTIVTLNKLKAAGLSIAVDDFGTGYSSLAYLKRFPIDALKIDQSFAMKPGESNDNFSICSAIIALAHSLKFKVIAEGVETHEHQHQLALLDCDEMQGYLLSKPRSAADAEEFIAGYYRQRQGRSPDVFARKPTWSI